MLKNRRNSCTRNSRHSHIHYLFVKDRIDKNKATVGFCPTQSILANFFTKLLNSNLFRKFKNIIMGHTELSSLTLETKERVENIPKNEQTLNTIVTSSSDSTYVKNTSDTQKKGVGCMQQVSYADAVRSNLKK